MANKTIVVPWDFTKVAEYAFAHALKFSKKVNNEIILVHIVKSEKKEGEEAKKRLEESAQKMEELYGVRPKAIIKQGSIFTTINEVAEEVNSNIIVMGTHGIRGIQKLTGSWALKVIIGSEVPFVVVQAPPVRDEYRDIFFPLDHTSESKQKVIWAYYLSKYYDIHIKVFIPYTTDTRFKRLINSNIIFTKRYFSERGLNYEIIHSDMKASFVEQTIEYAQKIQPDLILIIANKKGEQHIIANKYGLPIMCINPKTDMKRASFY